MPIFMMFGKYTTEAMKGISPDRTEKEEEPKKVEADILELPDVPMED